MRERAAALGGSFEFDRGEPAGTHVMRAPAAGGAGMKPTTVMLVDDHAVVRMGFRLLLQAAADMQVVAEADSGEEAVYASTPKPGRMWS